MKKIGPNHKKCEFERFYADKIVRAFAPNASFLTMGDANWGQPDVLYAFGAQLLGIEITGAYYSTEHAKSVGTRSRPTMAWQAAIHKFSMSEPDNLIRVAIPKRIAEKSKRAHRKVDESWLGIHQEAEFSDKTSTDRALRHMRIPKAHPFARIFLVHRLPWHDGRGYRVIQIFPAWKAYWLQPPSLIAEAMFNLLEENSSEELWVPRTNR